MSSNKQEEEEKKKNKKKKEQEQGERKPRQISDEHTASMLYMLSVGIFLRNENCERGYLKCGFNS